MKSKSLFCFVASVFLAVVPALGQFTAAELAARSDWETFLREAEIVDRVQMEREEGVTRPWKLTLRRGEVVRYALWKDASGIRGGFWEGWKYEIAAYLLDKRLGVGMVPPTVEKALDGRPGSCQPGSKARPSMGTCWRPGRGWSPSGPRAGRRPATSLSSSTTSSATRTGTPGTCS